MKIDDLAKQEANLDSATILFQIKKDRQNEEALVKEHLLLRK
jgi:hypothetical protein